MNPPMCLPTAQDNSWPRGGGYHRSPTRWCSCSSRQPARPRPPPPPSPSAAAAAPPHPAPSPAAPPRPAAHRSTPHASHPTAGPTPVPVPQPTPAPAAGPHSAGGPQGRSTYSAAGSLPLSLPDVQGEGGWPPSCVLPALQTGGGPEERRPGCGGGWTPTLRVAGGGHGM